MIPLLVMLAACGGPKAPDVPGVFVLGVDGLDPQIVQRMMDEGHLPNLRKLAAEGTFQDLGTSNPPQSPVAWSNFVTGEDPGGHGIFDFVHRDPLTYHPISSATPGVEDSGTALDFFGWIIPLGVSDPENNRGGTPWWDTLTEAGVHVEVYRIPGNFPTPESEARVLDGMGTVDMRGGYGTYTFYADQPVEKDNPKGDIQIVSVHDFDMDGRPDTATGVLKGAPDVFHLQPGQAPGPGDYLTTRVDIHIDADSHAAVLKVGDKAVLLEQGEWSEWVPVSFDALPMGALPLDGAVRFYARQLEPDLQIYVSPVNLSAESSPQTITSPDDWLDDLFDALGQFYTQGMPEETDALKDGVFDDDDYISQVKLVQQDTLAMLELALDRFSGNDTTFVYMSDIDLQCHMLWRHHDPKEPERGHPARDEAVAPKHAHDIEQFYMDVDTALGRVRERLPPEALIIVMSDHGFQPYTRRLHLNAWLRERGYLVLKDGAQTGEIAGDSVDWSKTKAYGIGFNGLYINREGREGQGIVTDAEAPAFIAELQRQLTGYRDPDNGEQVVLEVFPTAEVYHGARKPEAPDLLVGYNRGYGCSDPSTLGEITEQVIDDNTSRWSGNHLMAPDVVPGVVLVNRKLKTDGHDLTDVTASLLAHYGLTPGPDLTGHDFLN